MIRFQPVASDMRLVVSSMKVSTNLERVADQAVNIARRARKLTSNRSCRRCSWNPMYAHAIGMFVDSVRAYSERETELALTLKGRDGSWMSSTRNLSHEITERMGKQPKRIPDYLNLIFIARHLERVGDHAKNIGEEAVYATAAQDVRHSKET